jgi:hypothetical protein
MFFQIAQETILLLKYMKKLCSHDIKAPFTLYRIASERSDFHTGFGCCLHYATVIRYAKRSKNHSALEVIWKVIRYVPEQCKQANPVRFGTGGFGVYVLTLSPLFARFYNTL